MIPYGRQEITQSDIDAVVGILKSDFLTQGPAVPAFELAVINHVGAKFGIAVNSATSALHIACLALGLGPEDYLWTSPISFVASANCGLYCGAQVDFVDIDPLTYNMSVEDLAQKLEFAERKKKLPKVVIPVHLCGQSANMKAIYKLSKRYGFKVIEDASHAIGGKYCGEFIGNCRYSDITIFSFHPVKIVTTAEGGMAVTNNAALAEKMNLLRSHGITRDQARMTQMVDGPWYYQQIELGFNYRMTDLQAALGVSQIQRLDQYVARRHEIANQYNQLLQGLPIKLPFQHSDSYSAFHLYVIQLNLEITNTNHLAVFESLRARGIGVNLHYMPIYRHPFYQKFGYDEKAFSSAEKYYSCAISLPMYPGLKKEDQNFISLALREVLNQ
jgi:UDP-4-amino-4,6-dideoxy-N-acetyl-beta-L-altrosamine transaminase